MKAIETIQSIQKLLQVTPDGSFGPKSRAALESLLSANPTSEWPSVVKTPTAPIVGQGDRVDARSEKNIATLHPKVQPLARQLVKNAATQGVEIRITSGTRTYEEQNDLYEQGRSKPGDIVTNARGGHSNHNFGLALDVTIFKGNQPVWESPKYKIVGEIGEALGFEWGGRWKSPVDEPHFQLRPDWAKGLLESQMLGKLRERKQNGVDQFA